MTAHHYTVFDFDPSNGTGTVEITTTEEFSAISPDEFRTYSKTKVNLNTEQLQQLYEQIFEIQKLPPSFGGGDEYGENILLVLQREGGDDEETENSNDSDKLNTLWANPLKEQTEPQDYSTMAGMTIDDEKRDIFRGIIKSLKNLEENAKENNHNEFQVQTIQAWKPIDDEFQSDFIGDI